MSKHANRHETQNGDNTKKRKIAPRDIARMLCAIIASVALVLPMTGCSEEFTIEKEDNTRVKYTPPDQCATSNGKTPEQNAVGENQIPEDLEQSTVHRFTPYDKMSWIDDCKVVYDKWVAAGSVAKDKLAVIGDRYLIACTPKYGKVGDYIDFVWKDGTVLKTIMADTKSSSDPNFNEWGHEYQSDLPGYSGTDIIEFETVGPTSNIGEAGFHMEFAQGVKSWSNLGSDEATANRTSTASPDNRENQNGAIHTTPVAEGSSSAKASVSLEKDGYKIPLPVDPKTGSPLGEDQRGKGTFGLEQHIPECIKDGQSHLTDSEWYADNGNVEGAAAFGKCFDAEEEQWYINMRWEYATPIWSSDIQYHVNDVAAVAVTGWESADGEQMEWTKNQRVAIKNPVNGRICICAICDCGPGPANVIGGACPEVMNYLTDNMKDIQEGQSWPDFEVLGWCNNEEQPLGPCDDIDADAAKNEACENSTGSGITDTGIEGALQWMKAGCDDDTVGYCWDHRAMVKDYDGKTMLAADCSSYVYYSLVIGGGFTEIEQVLSYPFATGAMESTLTACGWEAHPFNGPDELERGDVLLNPASHTEMYFGENNSGGAHISENGGVYCGQLGDQTGHECSVAEPGTGLQSWQMYLRYKGSGPQGEGAGVEGAANTAESTSK